MRIPRLHTGVPLQASAVIELDGDAAHYAAKVLRLGVGDQLQLFNSQDGEFSAVITTAGKKSVSVQLGAALSCAADPTLPVHLGLGLSRGERMDYAIQKATELGVSSITPLFTERCEVKLGEDRADKRLLHWQRVAISACEQCGRCRVPLIERPMSATEWLSQARTGASFVLDHLGDPGFPSTARPQQVHLLIGPEGGLTTEEVQLARKHDFQSVSLGPRVLRTETAPIVALSLVQHLWGDFLLP